MSYLDHLHEETLEAYVMGKLPEDELSSLEDHLLLCQQCQFRTREAELDWKAKRLALQKLRDRQGSPVTVFRRVWEGIFSTPASRAGWAAVGVTAAIAAFLLLPVLQQSDYQYRTVELSAMRGGEPSPEPVQARERLRLHLDLTELEKLPAYHVVVVDASGDLVWEADQQSQTGEKLEVPVTKHLVPEMYWVRLMDTGANRRLLREYPLPLR
ncbi:MAG: hypothetical protein JST93_29100 [Acidobacteria bacterium]|nr:hypothetical protein [Acidobacteriota bacterium]